MKNKVHRNQHDEYSITGPNKDRAVLIWHHRVQGYLLKERHLLDFITVPPKSDCGAMRLNKPPKNGPIKKLANHT